VYIHTFSLNRQSFVEWLNLEGNWRIKGREGIKGKKPTFDLQWLFLFIYRASAFISLFNAQTMYIKLIINNSIARISLKNLMGTLAGFEPGSPHVFNTRVSQVGWLRKCCYFLFFN
jgi:hypothetical protein